MPEEYFLAADGDYFYVSTIELPWAQAQYECLARKGHLAELDGMSFNLLIYCVLIMYSHSKYLYWHAVIIYVHIVNFFIVIW